MKMTPAHYAALKAKVLPLVPKIAGHLESLKNDPTVKNLARRVIFDIFHASKIQNDFTYQEFDYTDAHIETAMKALFAELKVPLSA